MRLKSQLFQYKRWSIRLKLLSISALFILCSVFLVTFFSYLQYTKWFEREASGKIQQIVDQAALNIDTYLDDLFRLSLYPYRNDLLMNALDEDEQQISELRRLEKTWMIEDFLDEIMIFPRDDILRVFVITEQSIYTSARVQTTIDQSPPLTAYDWYNQALRTQDSIFVPAHLEQMVKNPKYMVFSIVKQLRSIKDTDKTLGVIKVDANYKGIEAIGNRIHMGEQGGLFIIDSQQNVIYSTTSTKDAGKFRPIIQEFTQSNQASGSTVEVNHQDYLINSTHIDRANWTIIAVNSLQELNKQATHTRNIAFIAAILCSLLAIGIFSFYIKRFLTPLLKMVRLMRDIHLGNLSVTFPDNRPDEIGYLGSSFNEMVRKIKLMLSENTKLVEEMYEVKLAQQEAQMGALFNQIKPHFIYNTLNMISLLMQSGKEEQAINYINKLSYIMRSITHWQKEVTLKHEIELLQSYLSIQSGRFEDRLAYQIDIDSELESYCVPAFILQPVVENAVIHGCELKKTTTTIRIFSVIQANSFNLVVQDDGKGMDEHTLKMLQHKLQQQTEQDEIPFSSKGHGIGLTNVNKRIKLKYGNAYGLTVESRIDKGTVVRIMLPTQSLERRRQYDE